MAISERPFPASVVLTMVDGRQIAGRITRFSPCVPDLTVQLDTPGPEGKAGERALIRGEAVAVVAFHSVLGAVKCAPKLGLRPCKLHLLTGDVLSVRAPVPPEPNTVGFYALPDEADWEVREYFVYSHGVRRQELDEPLGELLLREGLVSSEAIRSGLEKQERERGQLIGEVLVEFGKVAKDEVERAVASRERRKRRLGEILVESSLVSRQDVEAAVAEQKRRRGKRLGEILIEQGSISEEGLMRALSTKFNMPFVDLEEVPPDHGAMALVPRGIAENLGILPLYADSKHIVVAISDPLAVNAADLLRQRVKQAVVEVLATPAQLSRHLQAALDADPVLLPQDEIGDILAALSNDPGFLDGANGDPVRAEIEESDGGVIRLVNHIITEAYRRGASDIHIEPNGAGSDLLVRFRVDGRCALFHRIPYHFRQAVVARIKIMANLNISERRLPQDGKIRFSSRDHVIELRVATYPTVNNNEDVVMRILASSKPIPLEQMMFSPSNLERVHEAIREPHGLVLCVGPTGSGKTTTLHSALAAINTPERKILTAEDPVEITQAGLRQVQVKPSIGFTFSAAMRAFLRADPDVIMVGEMRDKETAETGVEASLTGHMVFSTLHTNSAPETITRLLDMGLDPFSFADSLRLVVAQRLARKLCVKCKRAYRASPDDYRALEHAAEPREHARVYAQQLASAFGVGIEPNHLYRARGCSACHGTGYRGRVALHEVLVVSDDIRAAICRRAPADEVRDIALREGMSTLVRDGVDKVLAGLTDLQQVMAVCAAVGKKAREARPSSGPTSTDAPTLRPTGRHPRFSRGLPLPEHH